MEKHITTENYPMFKKAYEKALEVGSDDFNFDGSRVLTTYAKYVVEYMESKGTIRIEARLTQRQVKLLALCWILSKDTAWTHLRGEINELMEKLIPEGHLFPENFDDLLQD